MTTSPRIRKATERFYEKLAQAHEPRHSAAVGVVSSVSRNAAGQVMKATVTLTSGATITNLDAGGRHGMGVGARVLLDGVGSKAATAWKIDTVLDQAPGTPGTGAGEIVSTPVHAFIESVAINALAGSRAVVTEIGFYLISEQWQYNQAIAYELEVRDATTLQNAYRTTTQFYRRIAGQVKTAIDDNDTTLEVQSNGQSNPYSEFDHTNGIALLENELVRYESTDEPGAYIRLKNMERGYASTTAVGHSVGAAVTWRGMSIPVPNLEPDTDYECHVRAINAAGNASNWSDWETFTTVINGQVPNDEPRGTTLVTNATFNANTNNWTLETAGSASKNHDTSVYFSGGGAMRIDDTRDAGLQRVFDIRSDAFTVTADSELYARVMVRQTGYTDSADVINVRVTAGGGGGLNYAVAQFKGEQIPDDTGVWQAVILQAYIPTGITSVDITLGSLIDAGTGNVSLWIDEVYVVQPAQILTRSVAQLQIGGGATISRVLTNTASLNFGSIASGNEAELTISVPGAASGDDAKVTPASGIEGGLSWNGWVSAADTVTVRLSYKNIGGGASIDPAARTWRATVTKF